MRGWERQGQRDLNFERQLGLEGVRKPITGEEHVRVAQQLTSNWVAAADKDKKVRSKGRHTARTSRAVIAQ